MLPAGIRFNDCYFGEPIPLTQWTAPRCAGLYVVLAPDSNWAPKPYQPLHFGEFGNNARQIHGLSKFGALPRAGHQPLYISALVMPFSTTAQRRALHAELVQAYNPTSQTGEPQTEFFDQPGFLEPPATSVEPRRRIGFLP